MPVNIAGKNWWGDTNPAVPLMPADWTTEILQDVYLHKQEKAKSAEPTLELNVKAKRASPFTQVHSVEEAINFHTNGMYMEYEITPFGDGVPVRQWLKPSQNILPEDYKNIIKRGLFVHDSWTVKLMAIVRYKNPDGTTYISTWWGACWSDWLLHRKSPTFVSVLVSPQAFKVETNEYII